MRDTRAAINREGPKQGVTRPPLRANRRHTGCRRFARPVATGTADCGIGEFQQLDWFRPLPNAHPFFLKGGFAVAKKKAAKKAAPKKAAKKATKKASKKATATKRG